MQIFYFYDPQTGHYFERLSDYLAYTEGTPDWHYLCGETGIIFEHLEDFTAWVLND
ncbi:hypothetical protein [Calothrix sp. FACHB-168]|nr:hypothetical protein [Calothrix sp. FACHB-168]MBD2208120.1 hypothetical protein [Calothrix sp. FACHB-168]